MCTSLPDVTVSASLDGWVVACSLCGLLRTHLWRGAADVTAVDHRATHAPQGWVD